MEISLVHRITVAAGVTTDLAGHPNTAATYTYYYQPKSATYTTVSNAANGVAGGTMAVALAAPIAFSSIAATSGDCLPGKLATHPPCWQLHRTLFEARAGGLRRVLTQIFANALQAPRLLRAPFTS